MPNTSPARKKILIDASVIIAGLLSPTGGSAKVLRACETHSLFGVLSNAVADEVRRNLPNDSQALDKTFNELTAKLNSVSIIDEEMSTFVGIVNKKDIHVVTAAAKAEVDFLVSLNRKHLLENDIAKQSLPFQIVSPKELIELLGL